ncbi:variable surface lipoprotein [Mycoplasma sp. Mirounga ES2805-ORL]|uniref:variable surface lipoprotein n=1 Tax=Mycoplasma sp. Mirounga ES2805-ORL TaxID=754514 RepID=UPI00197C7489|nr:variable surface lipoprotein [Mycoplasma sp. Mirounga ES2805-ORL]QSF13859.1 hypothetical protein JXZ90_00975 [Mycoplasma sp. Mirounga ES2805-ORL]
MKKIKKFLMLGNIFSIGIFPAVAISCGNETKKEEKKDENKKEDPKPQPKPGENESGTNITKKTVEQKLDDFAEELKSSMSIVKGKESQFYLAINENKDFYYDFTQHKLLAVENGKHPDWKSTNKEYLIEFEGVNFPKYWQPTSAIKPTYTSSDGSVKLSGKIDWKINEDNNIIFTFKAGIYKVNDNKLSNKVVDVNLGKAKTSEYTKKLEELAKNEKLVSFDYPNKKDTLLSDANIDLIVKTIPDGYELVEYKAVKNEEVDYYDITIIFKLKLKGEDVMSIKNQQYTIKGFKKTQAILDNEAKAVKEIEKQFSTLKLKIIDEKAYQNLITKKTVLNFDNKPNFAVFDFDNKQYLPEISNVVIDNFTIKATVKLVAKSNSDIFFEKEVTADSDYVKGVNPHSMDEQNQKNI